MRVGAMHESKEATGAPFLITDQTRAVVLRIHCFCYMIAPQ